MVLAGYIASLFIGVALGLIGGGGSILTVPVLVYLFHVDAVLATAYSLFIVGVTSFVGGVRAHIKKLVDVKIAIVFAVPSFIAVFLTRRFIVPEIPELLFSLGNFQVTKDIGLLLFFALIMVAAALSMILKKKEKADLKVIKKQLNLKLILLEGAVVGLITGLVGAGGGFLIIPALVIFAKLPMKTAVGTSLAIIAAKSLIGFLGDLGAAQNIDWFFLLSITAIAVIGIFVGSWLRKFVDGKKLQKAFGWFVLAMDVYIVLKETISK